MEDNISYPAVRRRSGDFFSRYFGSVYERSSSRLVAESISLRVSQPTMYKAVDTRARAHDGPMTEAGDGPVTVRRILPVSSAARGR